MHRRCHQRLRGHQACVRGQLTLRGQIAPQRTTTYGGHRVVQRGAGHQGADGGKFSLGEAAGLKHPVGRHHRVEARDHLRRRPQQPVGGHVAGRHCQFEVLIDAFNASVHGLSNPAHSFAPAKVLFDPFSDRLADGIAVRADR